jgi:hypothetical protein
MRFELSPIGVVKIIVILVTLIAGLIGARKLRKRGIKPVKNPKLVTKRPRAISSMCAMGYTWALVGLAIIISPSIKKLGTWYPALFGILVSLKFIGYVGVWHMKKWGVELILVAFSLEICLAYAVDYPSPTNIVMGIVSLIVFLPYYSKMNENL